MQLCFWQGSERIFDDVFGGSARVSSLLIRRRHYKAGPNFDAVVGIDLLQPPQAIHGKLSSDGSTVHRNDGLP
eukprot:12882284-Prorocentrum_lima.AAC.1